MSLASNLVQISKESIDPFEEVTSWRIVRSSVGGGSGRASNSRRVGGLFRRLWLGCRGGELAVRLPRELSCEP